MITDSPEFDIVVVGNGAAGMTAALTAALEGRNVAVLEKAKYFGGSAARSGDEVWVPFTGGPWFAPTERSHPGSTLANEHDNRLVNESAPYGETVHTIYGPGNGPAHHIPTWLAFDQRHRNRYLFTGLSPRQAFPRRWHRAGIATHSRNQSDVWASEKTVPSCLQATIVLRQEPIRNAPMNTKSGWIIEKSARFDTNTERVVEHIPVIHLELGSTASNNYRKATRGGVFHYD